MNTYEQIDVTEFYGDGLRRRREEAGLDQETLAILVGVSKGTIYDYESGRRKPSIDVAINMHNVINRILDSKMYPYGRFN